MTWLRFYFCRKNKEAIIKISFLAWMTNPNLTCVSRETCRDRMFLTQSNVVLLFPSTVISLDSSFHFLEHSGARQTLAKLSVASCFSFSKNKKRKQETKKNALLVWFPRVWKTKVIQTIRLGLPFPFVIEHSCRHWRSPIKMHCRHPTPLRHGVDVSNYSWKKFQTLTPVTIPTLSSWSLPLAILMDPTRQFSARPRDPILGNPIIHWYLTFYL